MTLFSRSEVCWLSLSYILQESLVLLVIVIVKKARFSSHLLDKIVSVCFISLFLRSIIVFFGKLHQHKVRGAGDKGCGGGEITKPHQTLGASIVSFYVLHILNLFWLFHTLFLPCRHAHTCYWHWIWFVVCKNF